MSAKDIIKVAFNLVAIYIIGGFLLSFVYAKTSPIIFKKNKEEKEAALQQMMPLTVIMNVPEGAVDAVKEILPMEAQVTNTQGDLAQVTTTLNTYEDVKSKILKKLKKAGATDIEEVSGNRVEKAGDWEPQHKHAEYFTAKDNGELTGYIVETYGKGYSSYINILVAVSPDFKVKKINVLHHAETPGLGDEIEMKWFKDQYMGKGVEQMEVIKGETTEKIQAITGATISTRAVTNGVKDALAMIAEKAASGDVSEKAEESSESGGADEH